MIIIWWIVSAHKWFKGPKVNIEHQMLGREENFVDGKEADDSSSGSEKDRVLDDKKAADLA